MFDLLKFFCELLATVNSKNKLRPESVYPMRKENKDLRMKVFIIGEIKENSQSRK